MHEGTTSDLKNLDSFKIISPILSISNNSQAAVKPI